MIPADTILALRALLGDRLSTSAADIASHAQSESHLHGPCPDAVAYPETTAEVAEIARACAASATPITPWGAGTSLEGHALAVRGGLTVDFRRMDRILAIRPEDRLAIVQPGITREALNHALRDTGLFFPVDPGANASLGGMASTRASGTTAVRYGTLRDNVRALKVVLAGGEVIRTGTKAAKSSAGYDLTGLFVGAEGTLGLITELTLRLHPRPEAVAAATCTFPSVAAAVECVIATLAAGLAMARIELMDQASVAACNAYCGTDLPVAPLLLVEFHGSPAATAEDAHRFAAIAEGFGCQGFAWAARAEDRSRLWKMRHQAHPAILASRPGCRTVVTDVCVPISALATAVAETQADIAAATIPGPILGHVGDGNFHAVLLVDPTRPADLAEAARLADAMARRALRLGGTITGEHGIGYGKLGLMAAEHGPAWAVMGRIKAALDPQNLMNPGKLVPEA